jgi:hypothetical protein
MGDQKCLVQVNLFPVVLVIRIKGKDKKGNGGIPVFTCAVGDNDTSKSA